MSEIKVGTLYQNYGFIGDITLTRNKCSMCGKENQITLEIDFCHITDEDGDTFDNVCLDCLNFWAKTL